MNTNVKAEDKQYIANTYARFPVEIVSGKGALAYDETGKEYIDMGSGIGVNAFGYADDAWVAAVSAQLGTLQHTSNLYYTSPCVELAKLLCEKTGMCKVFFGNSGAEANECAIKTARHYAELQGKTGAKIICLENSFHGRTITTLAATGQETFHKDFLPLTDGFLHAPANDISAIDALISTNEVAAIMIECIQGEGGVVALDKDYILHLQQIADSSDILLIVDEVQTGNGRTGKLYSYMHFDLHPDIVSTAKGLGGGLPLGATLMGKRVENVLGAGLHGSTFGGNPVCCAGAVNIIQRLDDAMLAEVTEKSQYIINALSHAKGVKSISGLGLMLGIETQGDSSAILNACIEQGVLVLKAKNKIRLLPSLNIPQPQMEKAVAVLKAACEKCAVD